MAENDNLSQQAPIRFIESTSEDAVSGQFKLNQEKFASLGDAEDFTSLKEKLVEINIEPLLSQLENESYFEITLPMTGMTDFLSKQPTWQDIPQQFPTVIAINGFGAGDGEGSFPKPYFIMATDIVGNEYEILIDDKGQVEVPEQGLGLFSILSSMTFMYSAQQILDGKGLDSFEDIGAKAGTLYLLPPPGIEASFTPILRISHLDDYLQREVDVQIKMPIEVHNLDNDKSNIEFKVESLQDEMGTKLHIEILGKNINPHKPYKLHVDLESMQDVGYHFENQTAEQMSTHQAGWQQTQPNSFEKNIGLSDFAKTALVRNLMSEFDFTKSLLQGETWGIENQNGFNDFGLRTDAIGPLYDLILDGVVHSKIPGEYLFAHVPETQMSELDLSYVDFDEADQTSIDHLISEMQAFNFAPLGDMLSDQSSELIDDFYVYMDGPFESLPQVTGTLVPLGSSVEHGSLDDLDLHIPDTQFLDFQEAAYVGGETQVQNYLDLPNQADVYGGHFDAPVSLAPDHVATTIHYDDIMDFSDAGDLIKGFDVQNDKIDLNGLLEQMPGASIDNVQLQSQGEDIHVTIMGDDGSALPVATLIGAAGPEAPDDLSSIIITPDIS